MITKKLLYVNIPGGISQFLDVKREDFEDHLTAKLDEAFISGLNEIADNVVTGVLSEFNGKVDPALYHVLCKYVKVSVGSSIKEAETFLEEKTGLKDINRSVMIRGIKSAYKAEKKKTDVNYVETTPEEALAEFAESEPNNENTVDQISAEEFFN